MGQFVGAIKGRGHIMRFFVLLTAACLLAGAVDARSSKNKSKNSNSDTSTDDSATDDSSSIDDSSSDSSDSSSDSTYAATVKALIDSNTCASISSSSTCSDNAISYYETFEYNGNRVIISSGAPSHDAENVLLQSDGFFNPNDRCTRWQFAVV